MDSERLWLKYIHRIQGSKKSWVTFVSTALVERFLPTPSPLGSCGSQFCWRSNFFLFFFQFFSCSPFSPLPRQSYLCSWLELLSLHCGLPNGGLQPILLSIITIQSTCLLNTYTNSLYSTYPVWNQYLSGCVPSTPIFLISINDTIHPFVQHRNLAVILNPSLVPTYHIRSIIKHYQLYLQTLSLSPLL